LRFDRNQIRPIWAFETFPKFKPFL
jgi:hypothetical protein